MKINRENYAEFFLDYFEGRLPEKEVGELLRFLELHPDLKDEFENFEPVFLSDDREIRFPLKASLKKDEAFAINPGNYESIFAAYVEGDLTAAESLAVEEFAASDPAYAREFDLMGKTKLSPDTTVVFEGKNHLKRYIIGKEAPVKDSARGIFFGTMRQKLMYAGSIAAAILLLITVTISLFPLREGLWVTYYEESHAPSETPVGGEAGQPGAVAEAPSPLQEPDDMVIPESEPSRIQQVQPSSVAEPVTPPSPELPDPVAGQNLYASGLNLPASRMESRKPSSISDGRPGRSSVSIEPRHEYQWIAYLDRPVDEADDSMGRRSEVSFTELALGQLEQRAGVDLNDVVSASGRLSLAELAGRGLSGLNNLLGHPVVVNGESRDDGRKVEFAIGSFIEVSRTSGNN